MSQFALLACVAGIVVALVVSRVLTQRIIDTLNRGGGHRGHFLTTPVGSALLFATVFVAVWCAVSLIGALPWLLNAVW